MVAMNKTSRGALKTRLISKNSVARPHRAPERSVRKSDNQYGTPYIAATTAITTPLKAPIARCAKLMTPVTRYMSTRPTANSASCKPSTAPMTRFAGSTYHSVPGMVNSRANMSASIRSEEHSSHEIAPLG